MIVFLKFNAYDIYKMPPIKTMGKYAILRYNKVGTSKKYEKTFIRLK